MRISPGTSLLEFQLYIALTAIAALFLAQLLLLSHYAYDQIIFLADSQLMRAAAYSMISRVADQDPEKIIAQIKGERLSLHVGNRNVMVLGRVKKYGCDLDKDTRGIVRGVWLSCDNDRWYCGNRKRALSCSWLLP